MKYAFDPEIAVAVAAMPARGDIIATRAHVAVMLARLPTPDTTGLTITDRVVPGPERAPDVAVRVYHPDPPAAPIGM